MNPKSSRAHSAGTPRAIVPILLPVRSTRRPWQAIKVWLWQLWRWRSSHLVVQPPLQPGRHRPFPQRPHQQRREAVFAALDGAPPGLTRAQLIAHVRTITGVGCSEKLITQWRKERPGDSEKKRQGDRGPGRCGVGGLLLCLGINACATTSSTLPPSSPSAEITISPASSEAPEPSSFKSPFAKAQGPRLLRIKLTLNAVQELRVKAGDEVQAGEVLSDRTQSRQRLLVQKRVLQMVTRRLQTQMNLLAASLRQMQSLGLDLPPTAFAAERAAIQRAEAEAVAANRTVEIQRERVSSFASLVSSGERSKDNQILTTRNPKPETRNYTEDTDTLPSRNSKPETRNLIQAHETAKLTQAQDNQWLAHSEIEWHKAKLITAQEIRAWEEQKHRIETTRQILSARAQRQQLEVERTRLTAQLAELNLQLANLTAIRAPFAGIIKRIEWEDMNDEKLTVLVYLSLGSR